MLDEIVAVRFDRAMISRAKSLTIVIANPALMAIKCQTPELRSRWPSSTRYAGWRKLGACSSSAMVKVQTAADVQTDCSAASADSHLVLEASLIRSHAIPSRRIRAPSQDP